MDDGTAAETPRGDDALIRHAKSLRWSAVAVDRWHAGKWETFWRWTSPEGRVFLVRSSREGGPEIDEPTRQLMQEHVGDDYSDALAPRRWCVCGLEIDPSTEHCSSCYLGRPYPPTGEED